MAKLIRMDLYRMLKSRSFLICLLLTFVLSLASSPLSKLLFTLALTFSPQVNERFPSEKTFSSILNDPFPLMGLLLVLLSLCYFFYADVENGYIKNIAGQMPTKGFTILSKFIAALVHNVIFTVAGLIGNVIGTLIVMRITMDADVLTGLRDVALRLLLLQSLTAILLLVVSACGSKSLGMILAVLFGLQLTPLIYLGLNQGLKRIFGEGTDIALYMPDTVMGENPLNPLKSLAVALGFGAVFLISAIRIFDRKDVK